MKNDIPAKIARIFTSNIIAKLFIINITYPLPIKFEF